MIQGHLEGKEEAKMKNGVIDTTVPGATVGQYKAKQAFCDIEVETWEGQICPWQICFKGVGGMLVR